MKLPCALAILAAGSGFAHAADLTISEFDRAGTIRWSNAFPSGVISIQSKSSLAAPWAAGASYFTSNTVGAAQVAFAASNGFFRLLSVDISTNSTSHFTNLAESYGVLETVAGRGNSNADVSQWQPAFEGEWATNVSLSRPHVAFGDPHGNVLIVDQRSSSVL